MPGNDERETMCQFISFFHNPKLREIKVHTLDSHGDTEKALKLNLNEWHEGHYLPTGEIICRLPNGNKTEEKILADEVRRKFPAFVDFFNWALRETGQEKRYPGSLYLSSLTSAAGLKLPAKCGYLYLSSLTSAAGLKLPAKCGYLDLRSDIKKQHTRRCRR